MIQPVIPSLEGKRFRYSIDGEVYTVSEHVIDESGEHIRLGNITENPSSLKRYWEVLG